MDKESCEENCQIGKKRPKSSIRQPQSNREPLWWNCVDGKCKSSNIPGQYNNPFECYKNCNLQSGQKAVVCSENSLLKNEITIIKGHMQSGKTAFMIGAAIRYRLCGLSTLIVVQHSADEVQLWNRFKEYWKEKIENKAKEYGIHIPFQYNNRQGKTINQIELVQVRDIDTLDIVNSPVIMITLAHVSHLRKLYRQIQNNPNADKLVIMIDESDVYSAPTDISNINEESIIDKKKDEAAQRTIFLDLIKSIVYTSFLISATILDNTLKEDILSKNIMIIPPPNDYKGINRITFIPINPNSKTITYKSMGTTASQYDSDNVTHVNTVTEDKLFSNDNNLKSYLDTFDTLEHEKINNYSQLTIPNITLIKNDSNKEIGPQIELYYYIKNTYTNIIVILWTSEILQIYIPSIIINTPTETLRNITDEHSNDAINLKNIIVKRNNTHEFHFRSESGIEAILTWLKLNNIERKNIVIIAHNFADRGISFAAGDNPRWHLTQMYYIPTDTKSQPDILQAAGRLCGKIQDDIELKMYATQQTINDIKKAYHLQEFIISAIKLKESGYFVNTYIREIDVPPEISNKIISRKGLPTIKGRQPTKNSHPGGSLLFEKFEFNNIINTDDGISILNQDDKNILSTIKRNLREQHHIGNWYPVDPDKKEKINDIFTQIKLIGQHDRHDEPYVGDEEKGLLIGVNDDIYYIRLNE